MRLLAACGVFLIAVSAFSGCNISINAVQGSGIVVTDVRDVPDFDSIRLQTSMDVTVQIGDTTSLVVEGDDNLCELIRTEVSNTGTLTISKDKRFTSRSPVVVRITVPQLNDVEVSGSGDIVVEGLTGGSFTAEVHGSGDIVASGTATKINANVAGSGSVDLSDVKANVATATVSGSGDIYVCASEGVTATVSGSGDIEYSGHSGQNPEVTSVVSGSGDVSRR
jgi:hypothetical protein